MSNNVIIEDRIVAHFLFGLRRGEACDYRVNPDDFTAMIQRIGAKVERDRPLPDESVPVFVTLHPAGGSTRVYAAADDIPLGEFRESPRPSVSKPSLVNQVGEALLKEVLKALTQTRAYSDAAMLIGAYELLMRCGPFGVPAGLESGAAISNQNRIE